MKNRLLFICLCLQSMMGYTQPLLPGTGDKAAAGDWLVNAISDRAGVYLTADKKTVVLVNGLVKRSFRLSPNVACIEYKNLVNGQQLLRSVMPEAQVNIDGIDYNIGGLYGQTEKAYLRAEWVDKLVRHDSDFLFDRYDISDITPLVNWKSEGWWSTNKKAAPGKVLSFSYRATLSSLKGLTVRVHYAIYDGLPLISKWVTIQNAGTPVKLQRVKNEILAMVEEESAVVGSVFRMKKPQGIYIETNYAYNNAMRYDISDQTTHWKADSSYTSQVNYDYQTPCLLEVYPDYGPGILLQQGEEFKSVRSFELLMDSYDRERRGLAIRRMYDRVAPWTTANPIFMHLVSRTDEEVRRAIDQCVATGYEAVILSFGSHCDMEDTSASNIQRWRSLADYAHAKGIRIGGYALFSSRRISDEDDVIDERTGKPGGAFFGNAPCFGSKWGLAFRDKIKYFFQATGFNIWENDGPYPGDRCASTQHPGHRGLDDSQRRQMEIQKELYRWLNERGVYINAPDWYFLDGTHKIGIGYREVNFSLPRENQKILNRQNIFDGTWEKTGSMSWGFVPLTRYQGGGPDAILEPLNEHLSDYEQLMMQYYGAGVQACYRGPRLFDTEATRKTVSAVIEWYKKYRAILNSPIIHLRRADGRDWDGILHVNPALPTKGLLMIYNPLKEEITRDIRVPLYYTGLKQKARVREKEGGYREYSLNRKYEIEVRVRLKAEGYSWLVIE